jgi:hypothetical protein
MKDYFPKVEKDRFNTNYVTVVDDGFRKIEENPQILQKPKKYIQRSSPVYEKPTPQYNTPKLPLMTNLYVGSLTVLGLFLVFRLIQKT